MNPNTTNCWSVCSSPVSNFDRIDIKDQQNFLLSSPVKHMLSVDDLDGSRYHALIFRAYFGNLCSLTNLKYCANRVPSDSVPFLGGAVVNSSTLFKSFWFHFRPCQVMNVQWLTIRFCAKNVHNRGEFLPTFATSYKFCIWMFLFCLNLATAVASLILFGYCHSFHSLPMAPFRFSMVEVDTSANDDG